MLRANVVSCREQLERSFGKTDFICRRAFKVKFSQKDGNNMYTQASLQAASVVARALAQMDAAVVVRVTLGSAVEALLDVDVWHKKDNLYQGGEPSDSVPYLEDGLKRLMTLMRASHNAQVVLRVTGNGRSQMQQIQFLHSALALQAELYAQASATYDSLVQRLMAHYPVRQGLASASAKVMH
jgi:hypothetical protein